MRYPVNPTNREDNTRKQSMTKNKSLNRQNPGPPLGLESQLIFNSIFPADNQLVTFSSTLERSHGDTTST